MAKKLFLVVGVDQAGSGSLTWPEDFDIIGVYDDKKEAQAEADRLNPDDMPEHDTDEYYDYMDGMGMGDRLYEVHEVDFRKKGKR